MPTRSVAASQRDHLGAVSAKPRSRRGVSGVDEERVTEVTGRIPDEPDTAIRAARSAP
jgi:hypothetical protein